LIPLWVQILKIPWGILLTFILLIMVIGAYSANNSMFDVWVMIIFGLVGYAMKKLDFPLAPGILTFILTPIMEKELFRSLQMSQGDISILVTRPISIAFLVLSVLILISFTRRGASSVREDSEA
jgi:putative tricarboxylic transport membrane protein